MPGRHAYQRASVPLGPVAGGAAAPAASMAADQGRQPPQQPAAGHRPPPAGVACVPGARPCPDGTARAGAALR
jgi:hypothetical protein